MDKSDFLTFSFCTSLYNIKEPCQLNPKGDIICYRMQVLIDFQEVYNALRICQNTKELVVIYFIEMQIEKAE